VGPAGIKGGVSGCRVRGEFGRPIEGAVQFFHPGAHAGMMSDDWRYEFIRDALGAIEDGADEDRLDLDGLYPYTHDRLNWLASHLDRPGYCDEAAADAGGPPGDVLALVAWGMDRELREVFGLVRSMLEESAEEQDDEEDE
jgi:hypothetical protein